VPELTVTFDAPDLSAAVRDDFQAMASACHYALAANAREAGLPARTELILTADFAKTVRAQLRPNPSEEPEPFFEVERLGGGRVVAKTMRRDPAYDDAVVVFDASHWLGHVERSGPEKLFEASTIAHELAHTVIERLALASRATHGVIYPSRMPGEIARSLSRNLNHEYRADWLADVIVQAMFSTDREGQRVPLHIWDATAQAYIDGLQDSLFEAYAEGPGMVQEYRQGWIDLETMFHRVVTITQGVLTNWVHARSLADCIETASVPLLDDPVIAQLPFTRLYLTDTLTPFLEAFRSGSLFMTAPEWKELDARVVASGELAIREIWRRLGLAFEEPPVRGEYRINVTEPLVA